jgi:HJR/Mrr/RecB family endonuclease
MMPAASEETLMADWIFQANPKHYDLHAAVARSRKDWWNTPRYRDRIAVHDRVWLQIVGPDRPGIYYVATIVSLPYEGSDERFGPWHTDIRWDYRIDPPLPRPELVNDPALQSFRPFRGFQGSNVPVPPEIASRLLELAGPRLVALDGKQHARVAAELEVGVAIERHNAAVRQELKQAISSLDPTAFELFVVRVLTELGFEVEHTGRTNDGGVDAEAVLSLEGLTSVLTKVQAKRWSHSVSGRVVRELRGALRVDERGLVVTTAEFTPEAFREAVAEGKAKIGLLGGDALVRLCAERGIGVDRRQVTLLELSTGELADE